MPARQGWRILVACWSGGEHARAQEAEAYLSVYLSPSAIRGTIEADRSRYRQLRLENSVPEWDYARCVRLGRAGRPRLPSVDFRAKQAALVPSARTNLTRFHGVLAPNSRYRESVTPLSACKVKPASADVEADGREEPNPRAGKRKGLCCTPPAASAKCAVGARAGAARDLLAPTRATGARLGMLDVYCTGKRRVGQWLRVRE